MMRVPGNTLIGPKSVGECPPMWGSRLGAAGRAEWHSTALDRAVLLGSSRAYLRGLAFVLVTGLVDGR